MRLFKLCSALLLVFLTPVGAMAGEKSATADDQAKIDVVNNMIDAWNTEDWDRVVDLFTEDGVLHSVMVEPVVGREALAARIGHIGEGIESITLNIKHIGVIDGTVFIERVDEFVYKGHAGSVPVVGVLEVEGDRIKEWQEYYDRQELLEAMGLSSDFDSDAR